MRRYCLAYDVKDSEENDCNEIRQEIIKVLLSQDAMNLERPLESTILFEEETDKVKLTIWNNLIAKHFDSKIFHYLCLVSKDTKGVFLDKNHGNRELMENFRMEVRNIKSVM